MARTIISYDSISQEKILENILEWVKTLPNYEMIKDNLDTSTMSVIYQLAAGTASWNFFYFNQMRAETYLSLAKKEKSIYTIARQFGYNINRGTAPIIAMKYLGIRTISIKKGTVIGKVGNLDVVYYGKSKVVEKGDVVKFRVGKFSKTSGTIQNSESSIIIESAMVSSLKYIDNEQISLSVSEVTQDLSKEVEEFTVLRKAVDFSVYPSITDIYIMDSLYRYGLFHLKDGTPYEVDFIEHNGYNPNLKTADVKCDSEDWVAYDVLSKGVNPESTDKIKKIAPLYYSTMRRAVTDKDYDYCAKAHSLIMDARTSRHQGTKGEWETELISQAVSEGDRFIIGPDPERPFTYIAREGDTAEMVVNEMRKILVRSGWFYVVVEGLKIKLYNADPRVNINPFANNKFTPMKEIKANKAPPCCTVDIYYIKFSQTRLGEIEALTREEQAIYGNYITSFKTAGTTIVLRPATREFVDIKLKVELTDKTLEVNGKPIVEVYKDRVMEILKQYELTLNTGFNYYEFLTQVSKITLEYDFKVQKPSRSVQPNQDVFDLEPIEHSYYVFNLDIDFGNEDENETITR